MITSLNKLMNKYAEAISNHSKVILTALVIGLLIFLIALLGIVTRPTGLLAAFWPANAVLLGIFIRSSAHAHIYSWIAAIIGYLVADNITGSTPMTSILLTFGNLAGVLTGFLLYRRLPEAHQKLSHPLSIIYLILFTTLASASSGVVGAIANPILFNSTSAKGATYWFTTELVNYLTVLPVILTFPDLQLRLQNMRKSSGVLQVSLVQVAPLLSLVLGLALGVGVGGPGALSFLVPGLLWCAISYSLFSTTLITLLTSMWSLIAVSTGYLQMGYNFHDIYPLESFRFGVTLISLAPLTVASVMASRNELVAKLKFIATHDPLTSILNRAGFLERAEKLFDQLNKASRPITVCMLDIDYFKEVNDKYGHAAGDKVLQEFSKLTTSCLRDADIFGRIGGEEFAVVLSDCTPEDAKIVAQRICNEISQNTLILEHGTQLNITVSLGLAHSTSSAVSLEQLLGAADKALYKAKQSGRNQVVTTLI